MTGFVDDGLACVSPKRGRTTRWDLSSFMIPYLPGVGLVSLA